MNILLIGIMFELAIIAYALLEIANKTDKK